MSQDHQFIRFPRNSPEGPFSTAQLGLLLQRAEPRVYRLTFHENPNRARNTSAGPSLRNAPYVWGIISVRYVRSRGIRGTLYKGPACTSWRGPIVVVGSRE